MLKKSAVASVHPIVDSTLIRCWVNAVPTSAILAQHQYVRWLMVCDAFPVNVCDVGITCESKYLVYWVVTQSGGGGGYGKTGRMRYKVVTKRMCWGEMGIACLVVVNIKLGNQACPLRTYAETAPMTITWQLTLIMDGYWSGYPHQE